MANAIKVVKIHRRELLGGLSAMGLSGLILACKSKSGEKKQSAKSPSSPEKETPPVQADGQTKLTHRPALAYEVTPFLSLGEDGVLRIIVARSEMGQGTRTAMAMLVADELDLLWSDVQVVRMSGTAVNIPMAVRAQEHNTIHCERWARLRG